MKENNFENNKPNITTGITHSGKFHCDDVCCAALLQLIYPNIEIKRVATIEEDYVDFIPNTIVFDIGNGKYDHHESNPETRPDGVIYSSFGKLYRDFAKYLISDNYIIRYIDNIIVKDIDKMDNGQGYSGFGACLGSFNVVWDDTITDEDEQFFKAVDIAKNTIMNVIKRKESDQRANKIIDEACEAQNSPIIVFDKSLPLHNFIKDSVLFAILPSTREGYNLQSLKDSDGKFRKRIPSSWDSNPPKGLIYNNSIGSLATFDTLYNAMVAANLILEQSKKNVFPSAIFRMIKHDGFKIYKSKKSDKYIKADGIDILSNNKICVYREKSPFYTLNPVEIVGDKVYIDADITYGIVDNRDNEDYRSSAKLFNQNSDTIKIVQRVLNNGNTYDI